MFVYLAGTITSSNLTNVLPVLRSQKMTTDTTNHLYEDIKNSHRFVNILSSVTLFEKRSYVEHNNLTQ